jgi:ABC-2 type transport system permease protein
MAFFYVLDSTGRAVNSAAGLRPVSPFYYYNQNLPLVPGHAMHWGALALLVVLCLLLVGAAIPLFLRRDVGRIVLADVTLVRRSVNPPVQVMAQAEREVWTRGVGLQALRRQGVAMFWWILSLAVYAGYLVVVAKSSEKQFQQLIGGSTLFKQIFSGANLGTNNGFLSALVFSYLQLLIPIFTGIMAYRWAADLDNGRLELVLGTPQPRRRVILGRYAAVLAAAVAATLFIWLAIVLFAAGIGFSIDVGRVAEASVGMLPLALITASLVFALAGALPPGAVIGVMAVFLGISFLTDLLKTLLALPDWVVNLSIFQQYGTPILHGLNWQSFTVMLLIAAAMLTLGAWQFSVRDVDRGTAGS